MTEFEDQLWKLQYPEAWWAEPSDECTTFSHPDGIGALQIFTYLKEGEVERADLESLATQEIESGVVITDCRLGEFHGFTGELEDAGQHWTLWFVSNVSTALCITYSCDSADKDAEAGKIQQILYSLRTSVQ
jgi:hypothetical protein